MLLQIIETLLKVLNFLQRNIARNTQAHARRNKEEGRSDRVNGKDIIKTKSLVFISIIYFLHTNYKHVFQILYIY